MAADPEQAQTASPPLLRVRGEELSWDRPLLMGIVNASPESFSDGADIGDLDAQLARALRLVEQGARIIDIGGQSGVTGVPELDVDLETRRVAPLVAALVGELGADSGVLVSVDTYRPGVVEAVLAAGASIVNDVSGLRHPEVAGLCADAGAALVIMHTLAPPKQRLNDPALYDDVAAEVADFIAARIGVAVAGGLDPFSTIVDPGPDFSKTPAQTIRLLADLTPVVALGRPVLMALSRKDFVGALTSTRPRDRLAGTLAAVGESADVPGAIMRVHDVEEVARFLTVRSALRGEVDVAEDLHLEDQLRRQQG